MREVNFDVCFGLIKPKHMAYAVSRADYFWEVYS
jgi:hypothetical protein